jgi:hypothetical protein
MSSSYSDEPPAEKPVRRPREEFDDDEPDATPRLGSLAQAARGKQLTQARRVLIGVGVLMLVGNSLVLVFLDSVVRTTVDGELTKQGLTRATADPAGLQALTEELRLGNIISCSIAITLGVTFTVFGLLVKRFPVPITILSLVLFIGWIGLMAILDPFTLLQAWLVKVIFIVALSKGIQAAMAFERDRADGVVEES